jgi:hypothetical protein
MVPVVRHHAGEAEAVSSVAAYLGRHHAGEDQSSAFFRDALLAPLLCLCVPDQLNPANTSYRT